jgi:RNA polymerase sigma factor (sigma-70 family)
MSKLQSHWLAYCDGNNLALNDLFDSLIVPLQFEAYYYTKDWQQAEDIAGDIFLLLLEAQVEQRKIWKSKNDCLAFLKVVIKYKSIDWVRMQANHKRIQQLIDWPWKSEESLTDESLKNYALGLLNEKEKTLFLSMIEGYTPEEIAFEMRISEKTVRNNFSLIRLKLSRLRNLLVCLMM